MTQKLITAPIKIRATRKERVIVPVQKIVDAKTTKAPVPKTPKAEEVSDLDWMNWVQYAQARLQFLENKLAETSTKLEELKETNRSLQKRLLQG
jgi:hypothetical protein